MGYDRSRSAISTRLVPQTSTARSTSPSASVAVIYAFIVTVFVYRDFKLRQLPQLFHGVIKTVCIVMILIGFASGFAYLMALMQVPAKATALILGISENKYVVLLLINVTLPLLGTIMDMAPLILIAAGIGLLIWYCTKTLNGRKRMF